MTAPRENDSDVKAMRRFCLKDCQQVSVCDLSGIERFGCWRLNPLEAHALHAIACVQSGMLGEAWATLSRICTRCHAGRALQYLEILADGLDRVGGRIERWHAEGTLPCPSSFKPA